MQRSYSASLIPVPKPEARARSKSSIRISSKGSMNRLTVSSFKRSTTSLSILTKSTPANQTLGATGSKRSRSISAIPSALKSRGRSPFKITSLKLEDDKKWISQQCIKVRNFLQEHTSFGDRVPDIRPPTINTFVNVISVLLKEIDPHIEVNTTNYRTTVFNMLKTLHYPGNITNSLLKTVNTMHAWPQVICIFAWLVDLITTIKFMRPVNPLLEADVHYRKKEDVVDYVIERYLLYNSGEDQQIADKEFGKHILKQANFDEEENKILEAEIKKIRFLKENQEKQIAEKSSNINLLREQLTARKDKIDQFYLNKDQKLENLEDDILSLKATKNSLIEKIKSKRESVQQLEDIIKKQPCTLKEKKQIQKHCDELRRLVDLKKEKIRTDRAIKDNCEIKIADATKMIDTKVRQLNDHLEKLTRLDPELKVLHLRTTDFLRPDFGDEIKSVAAKVKIFENKFHNEIAETRSTLSEVKNKMSLLEQRNELSKVTIQDLSKTEDDLNNHIRMYSVEIEKVIKRRQEEKAEFAEKIKKVTESTPNVNDVTQRLEKLKELKITKEANLESLKKNYLDFFHALHDMIKNNVGKMNNIRSEVFDILIASLTNIQDIQRAILEDLHELDDVKKLLSN